MKKLAIRIEGDYAREVIVAESTSVGWDMLAFMVEGYLAELKKDESLSLQHDQWDMFREELVARALKPWDDYGVLEAPNGHLWGVEAHRGR